ESQSRLMEACYDDYCVAKMAEKLGKKEDAEFFMKRSYNFRNLFDPETGFSRVKDTKGNFRPNFSPYDIDLPGFRMGVRDYTEGNAWQWTWHVQHDFDALVALFPSKEAFMEKFDQLFSNTGDLTGNESTPDVTGLIGMYAHGNEPSHHMAYFYTLAGQPAKTADIVRQIIDNFYPDTREGLCGNDDCGQMSAWYLFSSFGFYPIDPVSGEYVFGAPQAPWTKLSLPNGKSLEIKANGLSKTAKYVKSVTLNGKPLDLRTISYDQVMGGGVLEYEMTENK
ncbi:MAG: glycoside hydrolase family 92 protein, partial [Bacteroidales bacterium]|nr:glycoside hydrolase family 92 protein [Bacteroidales bacterium]